MTSKKSKEELFKEIGLLKEKVTLLEKKLTDNALFYKQILFQSEERLRKQNKALLDLSGNFRKKEFIPIINEILHTATNTIDVVRGALWLLKDNNTSINYYCGIHKNKFLKEKISFKKSDYPLYFKSIVSENTIIGNDVFKDAQTPELLNYFKKYKIRSVIYIPLIMNGKVLGIVCFEHTGEPRTWTLDEQNFFRAIVNMIAGAMETAERKKAEKQLKISEKGYYELFNNSTELIYIHDKEGAFIDVNQAVIKKHGYKKEEIIGNTPEIFEAPGRNKISFVRDKINKAWQGTPQKFDWWGIKKSGEIFPKELVIRKGNYFGKDAIIASGRDISERKNYENLLLEKEQTLSLVLNNIEYLTYSSDIVNGIIDLKYISPQVKNIIGFTSSELIKALKTGKINEYYHPDDRLKVVEIADIIKNEKKSATTTYRFLHKVKQKYIWIEESIFPQFDSNGIHKANFGVVKDVSERVEAEQELIRSEERYRLLFESNMAGVFRTTYSGKILECNKAFLDIFEYNSIEEIKDINSRDLYINKLERNKYLQKLIAFKSLYNYQIKHITKTGKTGWLLANVTLIEGNEENKEKEILGTLIDITELKKAQETLLESEEKFKSLGESAPVGIFLTDKSGKPEYINPRLEKLIDTPLNKAIRMSWDKIIYPDDYDRIILNINKVIRNKRDFNEEFRLINKDKKLSWVCLNATARQNAKGKVIGWVGTVEDITERKVSEGLIKESEERFKLLSEVAIEGIVITEKLVILDCNNRFFQMHGYHSKKGIIGKNILDFVLPEYHQIIKTNLRLEKSSPHEIKGITKSGNTIFIETSGMNIPFHGKTVRVSVLYDISQRKIIENSLKESERALLTLMGNLPGMAYRCKNDKYWTIEFASEGCFELTGFKSEQLIGNKETAFADLIHPNDRELVYEILKDKLSSGKSYELEYRIITASGKEKWVWEQGEAILDDSGNLKCLEGFITDISERKKFEQSRKNFKDLIELSPVGVVIIQEDKVVFANPVARDIIKLPGGIKFGRSSVFDYLQPEYCDKVKNSLNRIREGKKLIFTEVKVKALDGAVVDIETNGTLINYLDKPAIQVVFNDISYRKQLQKEQLRAEIAEETNKKLQQEIADRIKAENLLIETQKYTHSIIESSLDMICATDKEGHITEFNEAAQKAFGFELQELRSQTLAVLYADLEDYKRIDKIIFETGKFAGEILNIRKNGEIFTSYISASVLLNENGEQIGSMGVSRDITELKLEEKIKETQYAVTRILSEALHFTEAAQAILSAFSFGFKLDYGEIWMVDKEKKELTYYTSFIYPENNSVNEQFNRITKKISFYPGVGLPGKVWEENKTIWIDSFHDTSVPIRKSQAIASGFRSAFGFPIISGKYTLGVINFFSKTSLKKNKGLLNLLPTIGSQIGQFIDRKNAEEELRASEERFKAIYNMAAVGIARVSLNGAFIQVNQRLCDIFGYAEKELYSKSFQEITYEKDLSKSTLFRTKLLKKKIDKFTTEKRYIHKSGSVIFVNLTVSIVNDADGNPDYFVSVFEDITNRKAAEEKIFKQAAKLNSIIESSSHQVWTVNKNYELTSFNQNYVRAIKSFVGKEPELGMNLIEASKLIFDDKTFDQLSKLYQDAFNGIPQHFEMPIYTKEGENIWLETFLNPINLEKNQIEEISCIAQDITSKKLSEQQIKDSLKEKEVLLKEVHHRVKNNLQVISSILNLQTSYVKDKKVLNVLKESQDRIKSMAYIHESLYQSKDFSKINFSEYIENLSKNLMHSYGSYNNLIDLKLDIDDIYLNLDLAIPCGLIVNELVSNALKYAFSDRAKGVVFIKVKINKNDLSIVVKDNGNGFPQNINFKKTETLGLQLVNALAEQIKGSVNMETKKTTGTSFTINFKYKL